jgi:O-antigen/teichoic acid export membrane protein
MSEPSVASRILKSSLWQYLFSWIDKLIGFAATIILARILVPDDFGVVATASIITGLFHVISSVGTNQYLLRKETIKTEDLNKGWTINFVMKCISAVGVYFSAEPLAVFIEDERLISVLQFTALSPLLSAFNNIGMVVFEKEYNYKPRFIAGFSSRLFGFIIKIYLAFELHNYWAFVFAEIFEKFIFLVATFSLSKFRPQFSFKGWKEQWMFSQWILLKSIFVFFRFRIDNIFLAKYLPVESLGSYTVAKDVATLPAGQLIEPIMEPLYVGLSSMHSDKKMFLDKVYKSLGLLCMVVLPISLGTFSTSKNLVAVLLGDGEKWQHVSTLVMLLSMILLPAILGDFLTRVMTAMGKVRLIFKFEILLGLVSVGFFLALARDMTVLDFAILRVGLTIFNTFFMLVCLAFLSNISFFRVIGLSVFPLISSLLMVFSIFEINEYLLSFSTLIQLIMQIFFGGGVYFSIITLFVYSARNTVNVYQFIWKTFYLNIVFKPFLR